MNSGLVREFEKLLGPSSVLYRPEDLLLYEYDGSVEKGRPDLVVFPNSTEDVSRIAKLAAKYNVPIVGRGADTGLFGGALARPGGVMLVFARMNRILELDIENHCAVVHRPFRRLGGHPRRNHRKAFAPRSLRLGRSCETGHQRWVLLALRLTPHAPPQIRLRPAKYLRPQPFSVLPALSVIAGRNPCATVINKKRPHLERLFSAKLSLNISYRTQGR